MNDLVSLRQSAARGRSLHLRAPEDVHHLLGGVGAGGVPLPAQDLALGGEAELGGEVVLGLGGGGVHLVLLGLAVAENGGTQTSDNIPTSVLHMICQQQKESPINPEIHSSGQLTGTLRGNDTTTSTQELRLVLQRDISRCSLGSAHLKVVFQYMLMQLLI